MLRFMRERACMCNHQRLAPSAVIITELVSKFIVYPDRVATHIGEKVAATSTGVSAALPLHGIFDKSIKLCMEK